MRDGPESLNQPTPLTVAEVARYLRLTPETVRKRIADGQIPAVRIGHEFRIPPDWTNRFRMNQAA